MFDLSHILQGGVPDVPAATLFFVFFFGTFVSEDAACLLAGTAAATGRMSFALALTACFLGIFAGDVLLYAAGRKFGSRIFDSRFVKQFISDSTVAKASSWLARHGAAAVFMSRFVSGLRLPTYLLAGALRTDFAKFVFYFLLASAIWTPILVGSTAFSESFFFPQNALLGLIVTAIAIRVNFKYTSRRNQRLLVGRIKRITKWEFWPLQVFYAPVAVYILRLAVKYRSLTAFTAVNPAIPAGGFTGESKNEIYKGLNESVKAGGFMLSHTLINGKLSQGEKLLKARKFIYENGLKFPLVLKPDAGERGMGVKIIGSSDGLEAELLSRDSDLILQEFAPGKEVSIFYHRYPNDGRGNIFSITEKHFPTLIGDGRSSLEDLILNDARAVCLAEKYFEQNRDRLGDVPSEHETIKLIDIGTHSRGAIFLDGSRLKSDALERKIDEICQGFDGFYFGRFDIRTPSFEDLRRGENFKIVELNGVTSESTNIYDPQYSLLDAYRILFRQWRVAFEIGAANCDRGIKPTPLLELVRLAFGFRISQSTVP
ncbi:MAG: VTT domain-containing protein [Acidobacteria bacterium]|nr:VTT domain-containing protein [Acidobacteriota bacterium]